jgi:seryl-tRNA(Sec) selenium transferase
MKVAQEQIISVILALRAYGAGRDTSNVRVLEALARACRDLEGIESSIVEDEVRPAIRRVEVRSPCALRLVRALREGTPPIFVRAHHVEAGRFAFDVRNLAPEDVPLIAEALRRAVAALDGSPGDA